MIRIIMAAIVAFMAGFRPAPMNFIQFAAALMLAFVGFKRMEMDATAKDSAGLSNPDIQPPPPATKSAVACQPSQTTIAHNQD